MKRVVGETIRLCREKGLKVEPVLVGYLACLQEIQQAWGAITLNEQMTDENITIAANFIKDQVIKKDDPVFCTIKLQVLMEAAYKSQKEQVELEQRDQQENIDMYARAITGLRPLKENTLDAYEKFYQRMLEFVCAKTGLEHGSSDELARQEVRAAMESVFPLSTLARYLTLSEQEKSAQVEELARITLGICLFNHAQGRGGYALPPPPSSVLPQAQHLLKDLIKCAGEARKDLAAYITLLDHSESPMHAARISQEMSVVAQSLLYYEAQRLDMEQGLGAVREIEAELEHMVSEAQETVGGSAAVSKAAIFPLLDRMGALHMLLSDELRLMVVRHRLYEELQRLLGGYTSLLTKMPRSLRATSASREAQEQQAAPEFLEGLPEDMEYMPPDDVSPAASGQPPNPDTSLSGFCPVTLAQHGGLLSRASAQLGYLRYEDQVYGFASMRAMSQFVAAPGQVLGQMQDVLKAAPHLYHLLKLTPASCPDATTQVVLQLFSGPMKCDFGTQTPVHFVERLIDVDYEWNQWALRRRALRLANLRQFKTHSAQTILTHFKRDNETQVWKPKEAAVQTKVNKGQSMPKKLQYVRGLRGAPDVKMNVVRLDLDLGQPHQH